MPGLRTGRRMTRSGMSERRTTLVCALLAAVGPLSSSLFTPALVDLARDLETGLGAAQLTVSVFFLGLAVSQLICGPLSDSAGRKPLLYLFFLLYVAGSFLALIARSVDLLIAARFIQGIGSAAGIAVSRAIVRDCFSGSEQVRVQALVGMVLAIGPAVAPFLGGLMIEAVSWRFLFVLMLGLGVSTLAVIWLFLAETLEDRDENQPMLAILTGYTLVLRDRQFVLCTLIVGGTNGTVYAQSTVLPLVMIDQVGLSPHGFGLSMMAQTVCFLCGSLLVSRLAWRVPGSRLLGGGMMLVLVATLSYPLSYILTGPTLAAVVVPIGLCGFAMGLTLPSTTAAALAPFPQRAGAAAAVMGFVQMGSGVAGGFVTPFFSDPWKALVVISVVMGGMGILAWAIWRWPR